MSIAQPVSSEQPHYSSPNSVERQRAPYEYKFDEFIARYQLAQKKAGTAEDNDNYKKERQLGPARLIDAFIQARSDQQFRTPEQFRAMRDKAMAELKDGEQLIEKAAFIDLTVRSLNQLGYRASTLAPEYAASYKTDILLDLHAPEQQEWDGLHGYQGLLLHVRTGLPLMEVPDNQILFCQPEAARQQLLTGSNISVGRQSQRTEESATNAYRRQQYLDHGQFHEATVWDGLRRGVESFEDVNDQDDRPFAAGVIYFPSRQDNTHFIDWQTGELAMYTDKQGRSQSYLLDCLEHSFDQPAGLESDAQDARLAS